MARANKAPEQDVPASEAPATNGFGFAEYSLRAKSIPTKFHGSTVPVRYVKATGDAEAAMASMLALAGGSVEAVVSTFGTGAALDLQKQIKAHLEGEDPSLEEAARLGREGTVAAPTRTRSGGGSAKVKVERQKERVAAERARVEELKDANPEAYAIAQEMLARLSAGL